MGKIRQDYIERLYAGWLGKLIGVRHGAPIEGWTYDRIARVYGEITDYLVDYRDFAADDDTNGPMFLLRALEDYGLHASAEQIGLTLLNYAPYEHGFFWWGGYGISTEHTAYTNLRSGIMAPRSGSVEQNGAAQAEQIGGQIFIDTWGLVAPSQPKLAAEYAQKAASVTHGGNGVYGGMFIAACIAAAFDGGSIHEVIKTGLSQIPQDCEYARVSREVIAFHERNPDDWHKCYDFIHQNFGYDKYPGACHIIPNSAVMVLSMLYGEGDYSRTINICNMCGWDTDCNVGNVGTILGVLVGLEGIDHRKWRVPINDFYVSSGVLGSLNINDVPSDVFLIARLAYAIADEQPPADWEKLVRGEAPRFHFELPGSTHGFRVRSYRPANGTFEAVLSGSDEASRSGKRSLKMVGKPVSADQAVYLYYKTHYGPEDFHDSRYDPCFSPLVYPGQRLSASVRLLEDTGFSVKAALYARDENNDILLEGPQILLKPGEWKDLAFEIPRADGGLLSEIGVVLHPQGGWHSALVAYIDDFDVTGLPDYSIDFTKERTQRWSFSHYEVSQFTYLRGKWRVEDGWLVGSGVEHTEAYTGHHTWEDYRLTATLNPILGDRHLILVRVQGGLRSYAAGLTSGGKLGLYKNNNGYTKLAEVDYPWVTGGEYTLTITVHGSTITVSENGRNLFSYTDQNHPYLRGAVGVGAPLSRCRFKSLVVEGL